MIMKNNFFTMILYLVPFLLSLGCEKNTAPEPPPTDTLTYYTNPVFTPTFADPTVVKADDQYYYAYATEDYWEGKDHLVAIARSTDLVNWTYQGDAFAVKPAWKEGGIWAPNVFRHDSMYFMFYSLSVWGDSDPGIGLAASKNPGGPFSDKGKFFLSSEAGVENSIDPFFFEDPVSGDMYIFWGSFHGIFGRQLNYADGVFTFAGNKFQVAGNLFEGSYVYYRDGYYYYFGSCGSCCDGLNSSYHVRVGRSQDIRGPYTDPAGQSLMMNTGQPGKLLIRGNVTTGGFAGPGHNAEIMEDKKGNTWFIYHAIDKKYPYLNNGATRRPLMIDKLTWYEGWPMIEYSEPSMVKRPVPVLEMLQIPIVMN
jgi:arabinan endo-1,5-alpha-L-arabinosidase